MKKLCSLALVLIMALGLCACAKDEPDAPQTTETPAPTQDLAIYEPAEGKLVKEIAYNANGLCFSTVIYEYDGAGNVVSETTLGVNDAPSGKREFIRAQTGEVTTMISYVADGPEEYSEQFRVLYEYNESGLKMKETSMVGDTVKSVTLCAYEGTKLVGEKYYEGSELINEKSYEYNDAGLVAKCVRRDYIEGGEVVDVNAYDADGRLIKCESSADGALISRTEYSYDAHGNEASVSVFGGNGNTLSVTHSDYEYDEPGNITKRTDKQPGSEQGTVTEYVWEYVKG